MYYLNPTPVGISIPIRLHGSCLSQAMKNVTVLHDTWIPTCKLTDLSLTVLLAAPPCVTSTAAALPVPVSYTHLTLPTIYSV